MNIKMLDVFKNIRILWKISIIDWLPTQKVRLGWKIGCRSIKNYSAYVKIILLLVQKLSDAFKKRKVEKYASFKNLTGKNLRLKKLGRPLFKKYLGGKMDSMLLKIHSKNTAVKRDVYSDVTKNAPDYQKYVCDAKTFPDVQKSLKSKTAGVKKSVIVADKKYKKSKNICATAEKQIYICKKIGKRPLWWWKSLTEKEPADKKQRLKTIIGSFEMTIFARYSRMDITDDLQLYTRSRQIKETG